GEKFVHNCFGLGILSNLSHSSHSYTLSQSRVYGKPQKTCTFNGGYVAGSSTFKMDFFKGRNRFRRARKPNPEGCFEDNPVPSPLEPKTDLDNATGKSIAPDASSEVDDDDDDFITNEVKRRLKELRRNSFMMLIPEESGLEGEEADESCSSEGRDVDSQVQHAYYDFESIYQKYCERMLLFDRISAQCLNEAGPQLSVLPSPRSQPSKKLASPFRCLSLNKMEQSQDETERLQEPEEAPFEDLETAYVAHVCLAWEALHCQYTQLIQKISCQPDNSACYNHCAQQYQQFQVLLQRFIENEPFELALRPEIYARTRSTMPKLLQVPNVQASHQTTSEVDSEYAIHAPDLLSLIQCSILSFHLFLKRDKKKSGRVLNLFGSQNQTTMPIQQVLSIIEKKKLKLKELRKKKKGWKKNAWPGTSEEVELLLGFIDIGVVSRVLRMVRITRDQVLWCEDKIRKLDVLEGKLQRDPCPILFPLPAKEQPSIVTDSPFGRGDCYNESEMAVNDPMTMIESSDSTNLPLDAESTAPAISLNNKDGMVPSRCGSAPPYFEVSFATFRNPSLKNFQSGIADEGVLTDPEYVAYYNANVNLNPRLPPPLISRESRHLMGLSYARKLTSSDDNQDLMGLLSTNQEEREGNALTLQQTLEDQTQVKDEVVDKDVTASMAGRSKSFADTTQGLIDQTTAVDATDPPCTSFPLGNNDNNISGASMSDHVERKHENMLFTYGLPFHPPNNSIQQVQRFQAQNHFMPQGINGPYNEMPSFPGVYPKFPDGMKPVMLNQGFVMNLGNQIGPRLQTMSTFGTQFGLGGYTLPSSFYPPFLGGNLSQNLYTLPINPYARLNLFSRGAIMHPPFPSQFQGQYFQHSIMDQTGRHAAQSSQYNNFVPQRDLNLAALMYHQHMNLSGGTSSSAGFNPMLQLPMNGINHLEKADLYTEQKGQRGSYNVEDPKGNIHLETLRFGGGTKLELSDIAGSIVEFSTDQHGSRFIQQKLETSTVQEKEYVFTELLPHASRLMIDVFGNYVIQKLFEHGTSDHRKQLADQFTGQMLKLSLQMYGCRVIQKALEVIEVDQKAVLAKELDGHVILCVHDQNGNHVIQKCIEHIPVEKIGFIISAFHGAVATLSVHPYGCRVIQRSLEHCSDTSATHFIIDEILESACVLANDQYGNYVIQHILELGNQHERSQVMSKLAGRFVEMSQHKYASNVIEKCLIYGGASEKESLIKEIVVRPQEDANLLIMMKDQYANYVIQRILEICNDEEKNILMNCLRDNLESLKKYTYGKHLVTRGSRANSRLGNGKWVHSFC
ncbi:hypothetical protein V2J09_005191, partial [Rumex salicifolius]